MFDSIIKEMNAVIECEMKDGKASVRLEGAPAGLLFLLDQVEQEIVSQVAKVTGCSEEMVQRSRIKRKEILEFIQRL